MNYRRKTTIKLNCNYLFDNTDFEIFFDLFANYEHQFLNHLFKVYLQLK